MKRIKHVELNKFNVYQYEQDLKNHLSFVIDYARPVASSSMDVYGKNIIRTFQIGEPNLYGTDYHELENWYITLPLGEGTNVETLLDCFHHLAQEYEYRKIHEVGEDYQNITLHHLCDWRFLEDDEGHLIRNNTVTLVRYAKVLRNKPNAV